MLYIGESPANKKKEPNLIAVDQAGQIDESIQHHKELPPGLLKPNMVSLVWGFDLSKMGGLIQSLLPQTKNLYVISGTSLTDRNFQKLAVEALDKFDGRFSVHYLDDYSIENLLLKVTQRPEDSAILFLTVFRDANGKAFVPRDVMTQIAEKMLKGEPLTNLKYPIDGNQMMFDWRQLKRWSIDEDRLPAGSIVRYRKASV